eukprot:1159498-Pelagomonas_calceolata.AAC.7
MRADEREQKLLCIVCMSTPAYKSKLTLTSSGDKAARYSHTYTPGSGCIRANEREQKMLCHEHTSV